jgi:putative aldouronate transport system substrate-binding protein
MKIYQKGIITVLAALMALGCISCKPKTGTTSVAAGDRPDTWIADRKIVLQAYVDDVGYSLPDDQANSPVIQELKKRTGIELQINYTPGQSDQAVMAAQLAAGTMPDVILSYLNDSSRPEFPILLKAAKDGMFADLSSYFASGKAYNRYLEPDYLPYDTRTNIMWRKDLGGKVYLVHLNIRAVNDFLDFDPARSFVGAPYIQERIADALGIDVTTIHTPDDFYNLLVRIKNGGFTDNNGRPVVPLGPKYWGGSYDALTVFTPGFGWGVSGGYNVTPEGRILHQIETDWPLNQVRYVRKLLAEGLMDPEFFTMDTTRALEYYTNNSGAIMGDAHNYVDLIVRNGGWIPINYLYDNTGSSVRPTSGKGGYCVWAINADAKNPEEIFRFMDYLSTYEGQLLGQYGIEGLTYTLVNGKPKLNQEVLNLINSGDQTTLSNKYGASFGTMGNYFFDFVTNIDNLGNFGEDRPGMGVSEQYANAIAIGNKYPIKYRLVEGLSATAYLSDESMAAIKDKLDMLNLSETMAQAIHASSDAEAVRILDFYKQQFIAAGGKEFEAHLEDIYRQDPRSIGFYK